MSNAEDTNASEEEQHLDKDIVKETNKPKYFLEETDELKYELKYKITQKLN